MTLVAELSKQFHSWESNYVELNQKLRAAATFVEQIIDRAKRRSAFEAQKKSGKAAPLHREIEHLEAILAKLRERA